jgi:hypothetical protein
MYKYQIKVGVYQMVFEPNKKCIEQENSVRGSKSDCLAV